MKNVLTIALIVAFLSTGCATSQYNEARDDCKGRIDQTQEQVDKCILAVNEGEEYDKAERKLLKDEEMKGFIKSCEAASNVNIVYVCRGCSHHDLSKFRKSLKDWERGRGDIFLPRHANRTDFQCVRTDQMMREMSQGF